MEKVPTPHNNFLGFAISYLPCAGSLIETCFATIALSELRLDSLRMESGSYVDAELQERFSDLLFSVERIGEMNNESEQALVYFLFEHKSHSDSITAFQLLT